MAETLKAQENEDPDLGDTPPLFELWMRDLDNLSTWTYMKSCKGNIPSFIKFYFLDIISNI